MLLMKVHSEPEAKIPKDFRIQLTSRSTGDWIRFDFEVSAMPWTTNSNLPKGESAWGLWETDVVEVFVRPKGSSPYFEFQVSPLGQYLELKIIRPRKEVDRDYRSGIRYGVQTTGPDQAWQAWMEIPASSLGWSGKASDLEGGAFACLGPKGGRSYWAAFLPEQNTPDFHLPQYFSPIGELK
ncbi:MAG: hypothetical protein JNL01_16035 [Bdellovibrionales bacterium]|nr:hypothetical protein [Bdellovibrionales bacterium]